MIQSYYGNGKGKTTAAVGAAIRCAGSGQKVLFVQFLKNNDSSELNIINALENIDVVTANVHYELYDNLNESISSVFSDAYTKLLLEEISQKIMSYQMVVLDEVLDAVEFSYINEETFADLLNEMKKFSEIILTGHNLPKKISDISDYISEIKEVKHPYKSGVPSRKGIEY